MKRTLIILLFLLPMLAVSSVRFLFPELIQRSGVSQDILELTHSIDEQYQPGDIVYHVGDGSWVDMINYTAHPEAHYKMPSCGLVRGALSQQTRDGLGVQMLSLQDITWRRAWVINIISPMTPACEQEIIQPWLETYQERTCLADDDIAQLCVYLVVNENQ